MHTSRFTRLTNAFSKKVENHAHSVGLFAMYYNFVRIHKTLRTTPAMAANVTKRLWEIGDIALFSEVGSNPQMRFKVTEIVSLTAAGIACVGAIVSAAVPALYTHTSRNRELDIKLVEIGISILRADPKETQTNAAREWAIRIIEAHSGQKFSQEAKNELLNKKLTYDEFFTPSPVEWLSNESGPCSRANPCKSFNDALRRSRPQQ